MRLLDTTSLDVVSFLADKTPPYAILSHTWGPEQEEPTLQQIRDLAAAGRLDPAAWSRHPTALKKGYAKIRAACSLALSQSYRYVWIDTCCIDKTSSAELSEAINSMFRFYENAGVCYVFLDDVDVGPGIVNPDISRCRWFTRGWTLQELVAPGNVLFYDYKWSYVGSKRDRADFREQLARTTGVDARVLSGAMRVDELSVACRMAWAAARTTTRPEDIAYCLMGIFQVNMPLLYGEGERAFIRLQEEILRSVDDHSLFAWKYPKGDPLSRQLSGLLASTPGYFQQTSHIKPALPDLSRTSAPSSITNAGLHVQLHLRPINANATLVSQGEAHTDYVAVLDCAPVIVNKREYCYGIGLVALGSGQFARIHSDLLLLKEPPSQFSGDKRLAGGYRYVYVKQKPMWVLPELVVEKLDGKDTEATYYLVEAYPSSRWNGEVQTMISGHSHQGNVLGGFRYSVARAAEKFEYFDVFVFVNQIGGQLGNWVAGTYCTEVQAGQTLQQAFVEVTKQKHAYSHIAGVADVAADLNKLPPDGRRPLVEKVRRGNNISFVLKWSQTQYDWAAVPELDGKEIFRSGRILTTANLLRNRSEMDHLLALTRRMACEVVYDSVDITFRQNVNIVLTLPSKIRTNSPDHSLYDARSGLSGTLETIRANALGIKVTAEDGGELGLFEQYFANRLAVACIQGDVAAARELVQTKLVSVSLECKVSGQSFQDQALCSSFLAFRPIHWAALFGHTDIVRLLTKGGADRYSKTATGFTTVHLAALMGHGDLVDYLLDSWTAGELNDLDRLRRGRLNEAPGHLAAAYDRTTEGPRLLRRYKGSIASDDGCGRSAHLARNGLGETPLHRAAAMNNTDAISVIAAAFGDMNPTAGHDDAEQSLRENLDSPDGYGRTPLWHAAATGADDAIRKLLHLAVEVDSPDVYGRTPLHIACREGHPTTAKILLEAGADVNRLTTAPCLSACHFAALAADLECLKLVMEHGGEVDLCRTEGLELGAIHVAAANGWLDGVKLLVEKGCDPETSCSHYITARGHSLIDAGVNVARFQFSNAAELAVRGGHDAVVEYLGDPDLARSFKAVDN